MKAPLAIAPVPKASVPLGTKISAVRLLPVPKEAAGGVAVSAPVLPFCPETSMRIPDAVSVTPDAGPMIAPLEVVSLPATWICTAPSA